MKKAVLFIANAILTLVIIHQISPVTGVTNNLGLFIVMFAFLAAIVFGLDAMSVVFRSKPSQKDLA